LGCLTLSSNTLAVVVQANRKIFRFGFIALLFVSLSIFGTLFLKHPSNTPEVVALSDYLLVMGIIGLVLSLSLTFDFEPPSARGYNVMAFFLSFLVGLGFISLFKALSLDILFGLFSSNLEGAFDELYSTFFFNEELATFSSVGLPTEVFMLFVASIEELMFRVGIPALIIVLFPLDISVEWRWLVSIIIASLLFGMWHLFAYSGDMTLMTTAVIAGIMLSFAYRLGAKAGGYDLAFLGIVAGHYFWNLTMSNSPVALGATLTFLALSIGLVFLASPRSQDATIRYISNLRRSLLR